MCTPGPHLICVADEILCILHHDSTTIQEGKKPQWLLSVNEIPRNRPALIVGVHSQRGSEPLIRKRTSAQYTETAEQLGDTHSCREQLGHSFVHKIFAVQREPALTEDFFVLRDFLGHLDQGSLVNWESECKSTLAVDRFVGRP